MRTIAELRAFAGKAGEGKSDEELLSAYADVAGLSPNQVATQFNWSPTSAQGQWGNRLSASVDRYQAGLYGLAEAVGAGDWARRGRIRNEFGANAAREVAANQGAVGSFRDIDGVGSALNYVGGLAVDSLLYLGEAAVGGVAARGLMTGTRAALRSAVASGDAVGAAAAARRLNTGSLVGAAAASYPSAVGDILQNQRDQSGGEVDLLSAGALGVPYAALNALGLEALAARATLPRVATSRLDNVRGLKGGLARAGVTGATTGAAESVAEVGQEFINQIGRNQVDPSAGYFTPEANERYLESAVGGFALGGAVGAGMGGWRRSAGYQPPAEPQETGGQTDLLNQGGQQPLALGWNGYFQPGQGQAPFYTFPDGSTATTQDEANEHRYGIDPENARGLRDTRSPRFDARMDTGNTAPYLPGVMIADQGGQVALDARSADALYGEVDGDPGLAEARRRYLERQAKEQERQKLGEAVAAKNAEYEEAQKRAQTVLGQGKWGTKYLDAFLELEKQRDAGLVDEDIFVNEAALLSRRELGTVRSNIAKRQKETQSAQPAQPNVAGTAGVAAGTSAASQPAAVSGGGVLRPVAPDAGGVPPGPAGAAVPGGQGDLAVREGAGGTGADAVASKGLAPAAVTPEVAKQFGERLRSLSPEDSATLTRWLGLGRPAESLDVIGSTMTTPESPDGISGQAVQKRLRRILTDLGLPPDASLEKVRERFGLETEVGAARFVDPAARAAATATADRQRAEPGLAEDSGGPTSTPDVLDQQIHEDDKDALAAEDAAEGDVGSTDEPAADDTTLDSVERSRRMNLEALGASNALEAELANDLAVSRVIPMDLEEAADTYEEKRFDDWLPWNELDADIRAALVRSYASDRLTTKRIERANEEQNARRTQQARREQRAQEQAAQSEAVRRALLGDEGGAAGVGGDAVQPSSGQGDGAAGEVRGAGDQVGPSAMAEDEDVTLPESQTTQVTARDIFSTDAAKVAGTRLDRLGLGHVFGWVSGWFVAPDVSPEGKKVADGWVWGNSRGLTLTLRSSVASGASTWVLTHEAAHIADMSPYGGIYSTDPRIQRGGEVYEELVALAESSDTWNGVFEYPLAYGFDPDVEAGEMFAQLFAAYASPGLRSQLQAVAPQATQFMKEVVRAIGAQKTPTGDPKVAIEVRRRAFFGPARAGSQTRQSPVQRQPEVGRADQARQSVSRYIDTATAAFRRWFGDSVIVDKKGKPKVMYHGTARDITEFRPKQAGAIFLTPSPKFAKDFAIRSQVWTHTNLEQVASEEDRRILQTLKRELDALPDAFERGISEAESLRRMDAADAVMKKLGQARLAVFDKIAGPNIMPVYVRAENPFDYDNADQVRALAMKVGEMARTGSMLGQPRGLSQYMLFSDAGNQVDSSYFDMRDVYGDGVKQLEAAIRRGKWDVIESKQVQQAIKALGHDSFYVKEDGQKNLGVYNPAQVKSAIGNNGQFDLTNPRVDRSVGASRAAAVDAAANAGGTPPRKPTTLSTLPPPPPGRGGFRGYLDSLFKDGAWRTFPSLLGWLSGEQIADRFRNHPIIGPAVKKYSDLTSRMAGRASQLMVQSDAIRTRWDKLARANKPRHDALSDLLLKSTAAQLWPQHGFRDKQNMHVEDTPENRALHAQLQQAWRSPTLAEEGRKLYDDVIADFKVRHEAKVAALRKSVVEAYYPEEGSEGLTRDEIDALANAKPKAAREMAAALGTTKLRAKEAKHLLEDLDGFDAEFKSVPGPYFPLMRFGKHIVSIKSKGYLEAEKRLAAANEALTKAEQRAEPDADLATERKAVADAQAKLLAIKAEPDAYRVEFFETLGEARQRREQAQQLLGQDYEVAQSIKDEYLNQVDAVSPTFMRRLENKIGSFLEGKQAEQLRLAVREMRIQMLPDQHMLKAQLKRRNVEGYSDDALRAFAASSMRDAFGISRLEYQTRLREALDTLRFDRTSVDAKLVGNELAKRLEMNFRYDESNLIAGISNATYLTYLGLSPSFLMLNLTQPWFISAPILASRHHFKAVGELKSSMVAAAAMLKANYNDQKTLYFQFEPEKAQQAGQVSADEVLMLRDMLDSGRIDITITQDLGVTAAGEKHTWLSRTTQFAGAPAQQIEVLNRVATALAAYRLEKQMQRAKGLPNNKVIELAGEYANKVVGETHLNYAAENRARLMHPNTWGGWGRIIWQFRTYQQGMLYLVFKNLIDATRGDKEAQRASAYLAGTMLGATGLVGVPGAGAAFFAAQAIYNAFTEDDDEKDLRQMFYAGAENVLGKGAADVLMKGLPSIVDVDLSQRAGLGDLLSPAPYADERAEGRDMFGAYWVAMTAGAAGGMVGNWLEAISLLNKGEFSKAAAAALPKVLADPIRAWRESEYGVTDNRGRVLVQAEEREFADLLARAAGLPQVEDARRNEQRRAFFDARENRDTARQRLLTEFAQARLAGRPVTDVIEAINEFNQRHPDARITPANRESAVRSTRERAKEMRGGVPVRERDQALAEELGI